MRRSIFETVGHSVTTNSTLTRPDAKAPVALGADKRSASPSSAPSRILKLSNGMVFSTVRGDIYDRAVRGGKEQRR
jgi:hypothetical protein